MRSVLLSFRAGLGDTQRTRNTAVRVVHEPKRDDDPAATDRLISTCARDSWRQNSHDVHELGTYMNVA